MTHDGDDADVGARDLAEPADVSEPTHPHLEDQHLGVVGGVENRDRKALLVVEAALVGRGAAAGPTCRSHEVLRRCLSDAAGDPHHRGVESAPSPRREREERLSTIGRLLSGVIHDLKTPLTVISGYVQLMATAPDATQRAEHGRLILKQFDLISAMQREVLEFARGERNTLVRKVYLATFFGEIKEQLQTQLARVGVELVIELQDRGTARFDEGKILRVVHNLARNAAEAMTDRGGKFTIKVSRTKATRTAGEMLVLTFADTGPGIPREIEHRLFQSFVTSGKKGGTGLGLAITKRIAEEHGGTITVKSTSKGVTFPLRLPQHHDEKG